MLSFHELNSENLYTLFTAGHRELERNIATSAYKKYINNEALTPAELEYHQEAKRRHHLKGSEGGIPHQAKYNNDTYRQFLNITDESHSEKAYADGGSAFNNTRRESSKHNRSRGSAYQQYSRQQGKRIPEQWESHQKDASVRWNYMKADEILRNDEEFQKEQRIANKKARRLAQEKVKVKYKKIEQIHQNESKPAEAKIHHKTQVSWIEEDKLYREQLERQQRQAEKQGKFREEKRRKKAEKQSELREEKRREKAKDKQESKRIEVQKDWLQKQGDAILEFFGCKSSPKYLDEYDNLEFIKAYAKKHNIDKCQVREILSSSSHSTYYDLNRSIYHDSQGQHQVYSFERDNETWYGMDDDEYITNCPPDKWEEPVTVDEMPDNLYIDPEMAEYARETGQCYLGSDSEGNNYWE